MLLDRQGEAGHVGAALAGEIERQPAPAATDVEHLLPRLDHQLGRDVPFFVVLRLFEIFVFAAEIGAGILPVAVEKEVVELIGQIVMVGDVLPGAGQRVELMDAAQKLVRPVEQPRQHALGHGLDVELQQVDQVVKAALLDRQAAVDISLRQIEPRPDDQLAVQGPVVQADRRTRPGRSGEIMGGAAGVDDAQPTLGDDPLEQTRK